MKCVKCEDIGVLWAINKKTPLRTPRPLPCPYCDMGEQIKQGGQDALKRVVEYCDNIPHDLDA